MYCVQLMPIGKVLNLGHVRQRCIFIQSLVRAFFLLAKMGKSVPVLDGRLPLGVKVNRGKDRCVCLLNFAEGVQQTVLGGQ